MEVRDDLDGTAMDILMFFRILFLILGIACSDAVAHRVFVYRLRLFIFTLLSSTLAIRLFYISISETIIIQEIHVMFRFFSFFLNLRKLLTFLSFLMIKLFSKLKSPLKDLSKLFALFTTSSEH